MAYHQATDAQLSAIALIEKDVEIFLAEGEGCFPELDWDSLFKSAKLEYSGDLVMKATKLSLARALPALPPEGLAGSVDAVALCGEALRPWLVDPARSILPEASWPDVVPPAKVHVVDEDWEPLLAVLHKRGICTFVRDDELVRHPRSGEPILNGLFGVPKGAVTDADYSHDSADLRLIVNAIPANSIQEPILGDIADLPLHTLWNQWEVADGESVCWHAEDMTAAFYLFSLPPAWHPYFAIGRRRTEPLPGVAADAVWPCICVVPMGWVSACGVFQHLASRLCALQR